MRSRRKEKRTASSVQFSKAKERKRELCQTRKDQGKERSITLFMRKTCTNERTREQLTKATEFWQIKTNKNCAKEEKEIPHKSPREWRVTTLLQNSEMENPALENPQRKQEGRNEGRSAHHEVWKQRWRARVCEQSIAHFPIRFSLTLQGIATLGWDQLQL
jgi:hypothetical protein